MPVEDVIHVSDIVLVNTSRGRQLGQVVKTEVKRIDSTTEIQPIERIANADDLAVWESNKIREREAMDKVRATLKIHVTKA